MFFTVPGRASTSRTPSISGSSSVGTLRRLRAPPLTPYRAAWETIEHHKAFMADKEQSPKMLQGLFQVAKEMVFMTHVTFSGDLIPVLDAPVTEFAVWTLKEGADRAAFQKDLAALHEQLKREIPSEEMIDGGWGPSVEDEKKFIFGLGWHSLEVRTALCITHSD